MSQHVLYSRDACHGVYTTRIATVQARIAPAKTEAYETPRASNRGVQGVAHTGQRSGRRALHQSVSEGSEATVNNAKKDNCRTSEYRTNQLPISVPLTTTCLSG